MSVSIDKHKQLVTRLYRSSLRIARDLIYPHNRLAFFRDVPRIRNAYKEHKNETNPEKIKALVDYAYVKVGNVMNSPGVAGLYIAPNSPGGSKYRRNTPIPDRLLKHGYEEWKGKYNQLVDWEPLPPDVPLVASPPQPKNFYNDPVPELHGAVSTPPHGTGVFTRDGHMLPREQLEEYLKSIGRS